MGQAVFGPGSLYVTRNDIANQTPVNIGYINEFSYDLAGETKELYGQNQLPLVIARGTIKATGKMKAALVSGIALNAVWFAQTLAAGQLEMQQLEAHTIGASPYTITIAPPSSGTFDTDLGVVDATTLLPYSLATSTPSTGQYEVNPATGVYTFAAADTGKVVKITYAYQVTGSGQHIVYANQPIGTTPTFQIDYATVLYGKSFYVRFYNAVATKLTMQHKLTDFAMPEIDFGFFPNAAGNLYEESFYDVG